jgi:hypothetical protein
LHQQGRTAQKLIEIFDFSGTARGNFSGSDGVIKIHEHFAKIKNNNWNHITFSTGLAATTEVTPFSGTVKAYVSYAASLVPWPDLPNIEGCTPARRKIFAVSRFFWDWQVPTAGSMAALSRNQARTDFKWTREFEFQFFANQRAA